MDSRCENPSAARTQASAGREGPTEAEDRLGLLLRATRDAVYDWNFRQDLAWCNEYFTELIGQPGPAPYSWWLGSLHPEDRPAVIDSYHAAVNRGTGGWTAEYRIRRADGTYLCVLDRAYLLCDAPGQPDRRIGAMTDVSARKSMEDALRASEERFRLTFENGPVGMALISPEGRLLRVNHCFCNMLGYTEEELPGTSLGEIVHPDDLRADADLARQMIAGELPGYTVDKRYLHRDGHVVWARLTATTLRDRHGKIMYVVGIVEDITERKQVEDALRRTERIAAIGTLAAGLAHEINNPLGAIVLSADVAMLALDDAGQQEVISASLNNIQKAALRCGRIVKSILQFARDEVSNKWPCDLADVARHARDLTRKPAAEAGVAVRLEIRDAMPPLVMNPTEMEQVLVNLIANAIQASSRGSEVLVRLESWQDFVRIVVQDWGRGMSASEVSHIFDPFYTTRHGDGGMGLGLSITYGIVQQHGGTIEVKSQPGQGSIAEIIFPVSEGPSQGTGRDGQDPDR